MKDILKRFAGVPVLVVGDAILDRYVFCAASRISAEAPVPVLDVLRTEDRPGGAANAAACVAALGGVPYLVAPVGDDIAAGDLRSVVPIIPGDRLRLLPMRANTLLKTRYMVGSHQIARADVGGRELALLGEQFSNQPNLAKSILISDYDYGAVSPGMMLALRRMNIPIVVDPRPMNAILYQRVSLLVPNRLEAAHMSGHMNTQSVGGLAEALRVKMDSDCLVTLGDAGANLATAGGTCYFSTCARTVYDVCGAGDVVSAVMALAAGAGVTWEQAAPLAMLAAGIAVGRIGTYAPTVADICEEIDHGA